MHERQEIELEALLPLLGALERATSDVRDVDVHATECSSCFLNEALQFSFLADIDCLREDRGALGRQLSSNLGNDIGIASAEGDGCALGCEQFDGRATDATGTARDDCALALETKIHVNPQNVGM